MLNITYPMSNHLNVILYSGAFDRIHYALMLASSAAALNRKVTLFVTMAACHAFTRQGISKLTLSDGVTALPIHTPEALDSHYRTQGIAGFSELTEACAALNVHFLVCETGLRAMGLTIAELDPALHFTECGLVTLLNRVEAASTLVFV